MTYAQVMARLEAIEQDLADRQPGLEQSAGGYFRAKRDFEKAWAEAYIATTGTVEERRQRTILKMWQSAAYRTLVETEAAYEASRAVHRSLEARASVGQSLLRALHREGDGQGAQPTWSKAA